VTVCQEGRALCERLGFSRTESTDVVTAISEVAGNIRLYAGQGEVVLSAADQRGAIGIAVEARDSGPGIADVELAMRDGYSTAGSMGLGLPGARRLMDEFEISSQPGRGTSVTMRRWRAKPGSGEAAPQPAIEWATALAEGTDARGRRGLVTPFRNGVLMATVAGAGHGARAALSAEAAGAILEARPSESPISLLERCHSALRAKGGAAIAIASFSALDARMTWLGVGHAGGTLLRSAPARGSSGESAPMHPGLLGERLPPLRGSTVFVRRGDALVLFGGRLGGWVVECGPERSPRQIAEDLSRQRGSSGLVLAVRFLRGVDERRPPAA
jgi:serine/threonine-protein kinase RsbT